LAAALPPGDAGDENHVDAGSDVDVRAERGAERQGDRFGAGFSMCIDSSVRSTGADAAGHDVVEAPNPAARGQAKNQFDGLVAHRWL